MPFKTIKTTKCKLLTACIVGIFSLPISASQSEKNITLLLDWFVNPDHAPIILAHELGYFKSNGLNVEIIPPADPSAPPRLVAAGQADLAVSYQPQLHLHVDQGLPLVRVGTLIATPLNCLLVLKNGPIQSLSDLKGKRIGFSVAGVEEAILSTLLAKAGHSIEDIELINVNFSLSPSLMSKQVDGVIGAFRNFELNQLELEGKEGRCFYIEEEGIPAYDELIYVANSQEMDAKAISKFLESTEMATQYIINHPNRAWEIFSATSAELDDELNAKAWTDTLPRFALRPAALDRGRYQRFEQFLYQSAMIDSLKSVDQLAIDVSNKVKTAR